jgi:hypothetical protein
MFSITIARAIYRDRTRSVPDVLTGGHGDAAFANWVWLATYTFRVKHTDKGLQSHAVTSPASSQPVASGTGQL